jgi:hypothetical protein
VAGGPGFEPRLTESESAVLPLNYPPNAIDAGPLDSERGGGAQGLRRRSSQDVAKAPISGAAKPRSRLARRRPRGQCRFAREPYQRSGSFPCRRRTFLSRREAGRPPSSTSLWWASRWRRANFRQWGASTALRLACAGSSTRISSIFRKKQRAISRRSPQRRLRPWARRATNPTSLIARRF